jgi:hypothetical protein
VPAGSSRLASGKPPPVACACVTQAMARSDRDYSRERLPLASCSSLLGISCMSADPRAPGRPWATTVALHEAYASNRHRNKPSPEPILHRATKSICFREMLASAKTYPRRAALVRMSLLPVSDAKASSVLRIRERAITKFNRFHPNRRDPAPTGVQFIQGRISTPPSASSARSAGSAQP